MRRRNPHAEPLPGGLQQSVGQRVKAHAREAKAPVMLLAGFALTMMLFYWLREQNILVARPTRLRIVRPLLVVGTMASGTRQMSKELSALGLRISHEASSGDDGTVSWLHGLRLLNDPDGADADEMCSRAEVGVFHPMMLEPGLCPLDGRVGGWGSCWKKTCPKVLRRQYGCQLNGGCPPKFEVALLQVRARGALASRPFPQAPTPAQRRTHAHARRRDETDPELPPHPWPAQVRHPLRALASMVTGFCKGGEAGSDASEARLLRVARSLFPKVAWAEQPTCGGQFALFWLTYNSAIKATTNGWYRVEDTPPCKVLELAGMLNASNARTGARMVRACGKGSAKRGAQPATREHGYHGRHNVHGYALTYAELEGLGGAALRHAIEALASEFGYDGGEE
jgi:hypothetical protein